MQPALTQVSHVLLRHRHTGSHMATEAESEVIPLQAKEGPGPARPDQGRPLCGALRESSVSGDTRSGSLLLTGWRLGSGR